MKPAVLVVEDEPLLLLDGMCLFEDAGFEAIPAANAAEAICILEGRDDIKVVVTDIGMPGSMDGLSLCAAVRDRWPPIDFIIVSGQHAPEASAVPERSRFLAKPYKVNELLQVLKQFVAERVASEAA